MLFKSLRTENDPSVEENLNRFGVILSCFWAEDVKLILLF